MSESNTVSRSFDVQRRYLKCYTKFQFNAFFCFARCSKHTSYTCSFSFETKAPRNCGYLNLHATKLNHHAPLHSYTRTAATLTVYQTFRPKVGGGCSFTSGNSFTRLQHITVKLLTSFIVSSSCCTLGVSKMDR